MRSIPAQRHCLRIVCCCDFLAYYFRPSRSILAKWRSNSSSAIGANLSYQFRSPILSPPIKRAEDNSYDKELQYPPREDVAGGARAFAHSVGEVSLRDASR